MAGGDHCLTVWQSSHHCLHIGLLYHLQVLVAGRGQKGAGARKSAQAGRVAFEGGQMPIHRRIPKRGFKSHFAKDTQIVNLKKLASCSVTDFDAQAMFDQGFIKNIELPIKVLAFGTIDKAINVKVNAISEKAKAMIEAAGGKVEIV